MKKYRFLGKVGGVPKNAIRLLNEKDSNTQSWLKRGFIEEVKEVKETKKKRKAK